MESARSSRDPRHQLQGAALQDQRSGIGQGILAMTDPFLEEDFRVLTPEAFEFVLTNELKRALRSQNFVTLVVVEPAFKGVPGDSNGERTRAVREVARLISRDVRETDLISHTSHNQLSVVLLDADLENAIGVVNRLMTRL